MKNVLTGLWAPETEAGCRGGMQGEFAEAHLTLVPVVYMGLILGTPSLAGGGSWNLGELLHTRGRVYSLVASPRDLILQEAQ